MCRLCDRCWLGARNKRWGEAHIQPDNPRFKWMWRSHYNRYHPNLVNRWKRKTKFVEKESSKRYMPDLWFR